MPTPPNPLRAKVPLLALPLVLTLAFTPSASALAPQRPAPAASAGSHDFQALDADRDGVVSVAEFVKGRLDQHRFIKAPTAGELRTIEEGLRREAEALDANRDGRLSRAEFAGRPSTERSAPAIVGVGLCPFELCKFGNWQALERLPVYRTEGDPTRVVTHLTRQEAFVALTGNLHTVKPGEVLLRRAHVARGPQLRVDPRGYTAKRHATPSTLRLKAGDVVQVLTSIGEGYYLIRHRGKVYEVLRFWEETGSPYKAPGELRSPMRNEWWVQVRTRGGQRGWIRLTGDRGPAFKILDPVG